MHSDTFVTGVHGAPRPQH